jgi:hypothetical protein
MKNDKLAIAIPTYNRCDILKANLLCMMPDLKRYNIPVYISDDSSDDKTRDMIVDLKRSYEHLYYYRNNPGLGHDKNCFATLNLPVEQYVWYIGDSMIIELGGIELVLDLIKNNDYDFIVTNSQNRGLFLNSGRFTDKSEVFSKLAWHLTLTGACIYKQEIIKKHRNIEVFKNFPQTSIILSRICEKCNLYYVNAELTYSNKNKISYWNSRVFEVFAKDWVDFINCLEDQHFTKFSKVDVIKSHSKHTGIFGVGALINYRILGFLNMKQYLSYGKYINMASHVNRVIIVLISIIPPLILRMLKRIVNSNR